MASQRRGWVAFVLSLVVPGTGQLYATRWRRAVGILLFFPAVSLAALAVGVLLPIRGLNLALAVLLVAGLRVAVAWDALRGARQASPQTVPGYSRWYACVGAAVVAAGLVNPAWTRAFRTTFAQSFRNVAGSMEDTILRDEHILAVKWAYGWREPVTGRIVCGSRSPRRGELAVFRYPEDRTRLFIKRVIGLPGETVEMRGKTVLIDGQVLEEPYAVFLDRPRTPGGGDGGFGLVRDSFGPEVVPAASFFVLGDNRDNSRDSRFWGMVPQSDFIGRAAVVYWSWDSASHAIRWNRLGERLQ